MNVLKSFEIAKYGGKLLTISESPIVSSLGITLEAACDIAIHYMKCQRLFRPKFSKFKPSFVVEIREVSDTLTLNADVCGDIPV